ncbi:DUF4153 domain-containing protein [Nocardia jejuensis]|uniref:DUF4153 domain-containing protein n=1 Tax=Nocardia jejuensis TaxID=328049 RepID=UPI000ADFCFD1|nr:DUF4153 domain-containing protein [Nocardia jejuensis]
MPTTPTPGPLAVWSAVPPPPRPPRPPDLGDLLPASALLPPLSAMPVPRSRRVPLPRAVLPAIAVSGVGAVVLIPTDRPGIGWFLAGLASTAAIYTADRRARWTSAVTPADEDSGGLSKDPTAAPMTATGPVVADDDGHTTVAGTDSADHRAAASGAPRAANHTARAEKACTATESDPAVPSGASPGSVTAVEGSAVTEPGRPEVADAEASGSSASSAPRTPATDDSASTEHGIPAPGGSEPVTETGSATNELGASLVNPTLESESPAPRAPHEEVGAAPADRRPAAVEPHESAEKTPATGAADRASTSDPDNAAQSDDRSDESAAAGISGSDAGRWRTWGRVFWIGMALGLLGVGAVRAAPWLFVLCVLGAAVAGSFAVVARRSVHGALFDAIAVPVMAAQTVPWLYRGLERIRLRRGGARERVWLSLGVTVLLLMMIVPLLAGADAVFAQLVDGLIPTVNGKTVSRWAVVFLVAGLGTAGALYLLAGPLAAAEVHGVHQNSSTTRAGRFSRLEWGLPMAALTLVFAVFMATQLAVLFGGDDYVQRTAALTYAEYARNGFAQLSIVSMLTLAVIAIVQRYAAQESAGDRRWLRIAVSVVSVLVLVIVASALQRMWLYQQAYGFTVLRLLVEVFELWIAGVYVLVLASLVELRRGWVPRAAAGTAAVTLLAVALLNPERFVADRNIDRWQSEGKLDTGYLDSLSPDALPALERLPETQREEIAVRIRAAIEDDTWQGWNLSRSSGRR